MQTVQVQTDGAASTAELLNPLWWLQSAGAGHFTFTAPEINNGTPYLPAITNQYLRNLLWFLRNPCGNFVGYVIGLNGVDYTAIGSDNVLANTGRDTSPVTYGWRWAVLNYKWLYLPYVNYYGGLPLYNGSVEFYLGWRPGGGGGLGAKLVFPGLSL